MQNTMQIIVRIVIIIIIIIIVCWRVFFEIFEFDVEITMVLYAAISVFSLSFSLTAAILKVWL